MRFDVMRPGLALAVASILATGVEAADTPKPGGTLTYAVTAEAPTFDCHATTTYAAIHVLAPHYSLLVKIDQHDYPKVKPDLAESWQVSPDGLTYTFKLRSGVLFHDGAPLTSADVKASLDRVRKPPEGVVSVRKAAFEEVADIAAPDPLTVVMTMKRPDPQILDLIALPFNCIYRAEKLAADPQFPAKTILGTGPFVATEHVAGSHFLGKRFDKYFEKDKPYLDGFKAQLMKAAALGPGFQGGQIQAEFRSITPAERDRLVQTMGDKIKTQESPWLCKVEMMFNSERKPFDDIRVRQAISMAIDRWGGSAALAKISILKSVGGPLRPGNVYALPDDELAKLPGFRRNAEAERAAAQKLLAEAGVKDLKLKLTNRNVSQPFTPAGVYVVDQLRRIGVTAEHAQLDVSTQKKSIAAGDYDVALDGFCGDNEDPRPLLLAYLSKSRSPRNMSRNEAPEVDAAFDRYKAATTSAEQKEAAYAAQRAILNGSYSVPVLWYNRIVAHTSAVKGWTITPSHFVGQNLADVWLDQ
ncbi:MAG: ABC transporter substrate-binding protein [Hyphomicrobiaceae bacterium]|nr:ABC transporter substrate-binding protein [Hyphomicrobiaceae bacterium]